MKPTLEEKLATKPDPACGSGSFLADLIDNLALALEREIAKKAKAKAVGMYFSPTKWRKNDAKTDA